MDFLERDLEDIIYNASFSDLAKAGLSVIGKRFRQLKIGNYGISDLVTASIMADDYGEKYYKITIYELKLNNIDLNAYLQLVKYATGILSYMRERTELNVVIDFVLIGKKISQDSPILYFNQLIHNHLPNEGYSGLGDLNLYTYTYNIDGLKFILTIGYYTLVNEGFNL
jgi:hypothetical protein